MFRRHPRVGRFNLVQLLHKVMARDLYNPDVKEFPMAETNPTRRILIVDDEENVCHALRRSLRKEGFELFFGREPAEGLEVLKKQPMDMVISDHLMPNMTGLEFLKLVRGIGTPT